MRTFTLLAALAMAAGMAQAEKVGGGLYRTGVEKVGNWELSRLSRDAAGKQVVSCLAMVITGTEQALRVERNKKTVVWGFMGNATGAVGPTAKVGYWFDAAKAARKDVTVKLLRAPEDESEWLTFAQTNAEPGDADGFMNAKTVTFNYKYGKENILQSYSLKGANAALKKMFACGEKL